MSSVARRDYVLDGVCRYYNIPKEELIFPRARTADRYHRKRITIKILRDKAELSLKDIKNAFKHGDEANTYQIYQRISDDLSAGFSINTELKNEYADLLKFLGI
jgi:chromosomal replication initiation ATPase DnaA